MKVPGLLALALLCVLSHAERLVFIPLDSRPSSIDVPEMMIEVSQWKIILPPEDLLGKFLEPGNPESLVAWLRQVNLREGDAVVLSADMVAYGGLVASRVPAVASQVAIKRLSILHEIKQKHPSVPLYVFTALMRTAPTATARNREWRDELTRYVELNDRYQRTKEPSLLPTLKSLKAKIPQDELERYFLARARNLRVQRALIRMVKEGTIDYLIVGADDARAYGPQYQELSELRSTAERLGIAGRVYFLDGVDQCGNLLISRAILRSAGLTPYVWVEYSDSARARTRTAYEMRPLTVVVRDQILASGARLAPSKDSADYTLFVRTPKAGQETLRVFLQRLRQSIAEQKKVAVADVSAEMGRADSQIVAEVFAPHVNLSRLLAYVGWNTAGNTLGMSISQANIYLNALKNNSNAIQRETAHVKFLLHRYIFDYSFNTLVRPIAFDVVSLEENGAKEHLSDDALKRLQTFVQQTLERVVQRAYSEVFSRITISSEGVHYRVAKVENVFVSLPWNRVWEVRVRFDVALEVMQDFKAPVRAP